jgi:hypothetical protein
MKLLNNFRQWRARRRHERHIRWLRKMRIVLPRMPHHTTQRNRPGCVGRVE